MFHAMTLVRTVEELGSALAGAQPVFVPTMGALHAGHAALICRATGVALPSRPVVVSIFVNPTQFGPAEDFTRYPRQLEADVQLAESAGASVIFAPDVSTMYPPDDPVPVPQLPAVATQPKLEDAHRPTHFAGVCQVVARLFDLVQPSAAVFGEKDYQQLQVITAMVKHEGNRWPGLKVIPHPTVREPDGLAMSSRNVYLKPLERDRALGLWRALQAAQQATAPATAEDSMNEILLQHGMTVDYAVVRHAATLMPIKTQRLPSRALIAAKLGTVRLIDNLALGD